MNLVPNHKFDIETCEELARACDEVVYEKYAELLEWLQDMNWPVAKLVSQKLTSLESIPVEPVLDVLNGDDSIWKYWLIDGLLMKMPGKIPDDVADKLIAIINKPTKGEIEERVNLIALDVIHFC